MSRLFKMRRACFGLACLAWLQNGWAVEIPQGEMSASAALPRLMVLAENEVTPAAAVPAAVPDLSAPQPAATVVTPRPVAAEYEPPLLTGGNIHEFLGISTLVLAGLTSVINPGEGCEHNCNPNAPRQTNGTHAQLAKATVVTAAATIAAGMIAHWDDFYLEDGWSDPDNLHVLLGVLGAGMMAYAVQKSMATTTGTVSHAGIAEAGALGMLLAVKLTW